MDSFSIVAATGSYQFKINHSKTKDMAIGKCIASPEFQVGGHDWAVMYFPRGNAKAKNGKNMSVFLKLKTEPVDVSATLEFVLLDKNGDVSSTTLKKSSHTFTSDEKDWGWSSFLKRTKLEKTYVKDDYFVLKVSVTLNESCKGPHQNPGSTCFPHDSIQKFREENKQIDVTFIVQGNNFVAHRLILAAHSPVFEAELFGSMAESNQDQITINDMMPSVFKAMLDFMYSGSLPAVEKLGDDEETMLSTAFFHNLLVAADRYAVEKLKSACEHKLVQSISLNNILSLLELAETHNCRGLKKECLKFIVGKDNSVSLIVSEEYIKLVQRYPSLLAELKEVASRKDILEILKQGANQDM